MPKDYGSWSLAALKDELRKRKAKVTGRKAILVQRLMDYDLMFGPLINDPESSYKIDVPKPELFFDVNSNSVIPNITEADILRYSFLGERENMATSRNMYNENYLIACRVAQLDAVCFIVAVCAAEMRKNIVYNITIKIVDNSIMEAQCECAAGMGPYAQCKHVLVVMYGLEEFTITGIIKVKTSPTSNLQVFHQPAQIYMGIPVMANHLKLKQNDRNLKKISTFDPRPNIETKEQYRQKFINFTINFASSHHTNISMPIQQLRMPANKIAVYKDHDYLERTVEEGYLESLLLTEEERKKLELDTRNNKKYWKKLRLTRLHSSDFEQICHCKSNKEKLSKSLLKNIEIVTLATKHGLKYEKSALKKLSEHTGHQIQTCGMFVHEQYQFLASTPDGLIEDDAVVEVKCPYSAREKCISSDTVSYLYLCDETGNWKLKENHKYYYQVQGQMMCTGRKLCYFGVYTITDFLVIKIEKNEDFIKDMFQALHKFYQEHYKQQFLCKYLYNIKV